MAFTTGTVGLPSDPMLSASVLVPDELPSVRLDVRSVVPAASTVTPKVALSATVTVRWIEQGVLLSGGLPELAKARAAGDVWIDVLAPDEATIASLAETFGIHPLTAEDYAPMPLPALVEAGSCLRDRESSAA